MSESWRGRQVRNILESFDCSALMIDDPESGYVEVLLPNGRRSFTEGQLRNNTMDVVRVVYRGPSLDPSPLEIEAAWKSVEVDDGKLH